MNNLLSELEHECLVLNLKTSLKTLPQLEAYPASLVDKNTLEVQIKKNDSLNTLFQILTKLEIEVLSMRNKSNRLEQLFLDLVKKEHHLHQ